jgi:hypothetical protein
MIVNSTEKRLCFKDEGIEIQHIDVDKLGFFYATARKAPLVSFDQTE